MNTEHIKFRTIPKSKAIVEYFIIFGLFSSLILFDFNFNGIELYLTTPLSIFISFLIIVGFCKRLRMHKSVFYLVGLTLMVLLCSIYSWGKGFSSPNIRDINESIKYAQFIPYLVAISFVNLNSFRRRSFIALDVSMLIVIFIGCIQVYSLPLNEFFLKLYLGDDSVHFASALTGYRITLTGSNPNNGAVIVFLFASYSLAKVLIEKKNIYIISFFILVFLGFQTQSRTAIIAFAISFIIYYLLFFKLNVIYKIITFSFFLFVFYLLFLLVDLDYVILGLKMAASGDNNSVNVRLDSLLFAYELFASSPFFGVGPAKSEFSTNIDSEYILILQRYGILGFILFGSFIGYLFKKSINNIKSVEGVTLFLSMIISIFVMATNNVFSGYQLMSMLIFLLILNVSLERVKRINKTVGNA